MTIPFKGMKEMWTLSKRIEAFLLKEEVEGDIIETLQSQEGTRTSTNPEMLK